MAGYLITSTFTLSGILALVCIVAYGLLQRRGPNAHFRGLLTFGLFLSCAVLLMLILALLYRPMRRMNRMRRLREQQQRLQRK